MASQLVGAGLGIATSLLGAGKESDAINKAANIQSTAANKAGTIASNATDSSLNFTKGIYSTAQTAEQPYQAAGNASLAQLSAGEAPGGQFNSSPTAQQILAQDPGYAFQLQQGQQALERAESAGGGVGSGGALKAAEQYGNDYAASSYQNAFNRFETNRQNNYADLSGTANLGQTANQSLGSIGTAASGIAANTALSGAAAQGNYLTQGANAQAGGLIGSANAWTGALSNIGNIGQQMLAGNQSGYQAGTGAAGMPQLPYANQSPYAPTYSLGDLSAYNGAYNDYSGNFGQAAG